MDVQRTIDSSQSLPERLARVSGCESRDCSIQQQGFAVRLTQIEMTP
jgi:hypothetical protein